MKKLVALALIAVLSFVVLAPLPAFAGASTDAALALGAFAVLNQVVRGETVFNNPQPVYGPQPYSAYPQPVFAPPVYRSPVCAGTLTQEYGWQADPYGGPPHYVPTGRTFCSGQILY